MYCTSCGKQMDNDSKYCVSCGAPNPFQAPITKRTDPDDKPSFGFAVLGFFFPLVGLILYIVFSDRTPQKAKSVGKGALTGVITSVAVGVIIGIITVILCCAFIPMAVLSDDWDRDIDSRIEDVVDIYDDAEYDEDLADDMDVKIGVFTTGQNEDGSKYSYLELTVKNISEDEVEGFIAVEAWKDDTRIASDTAYVGSLQPGQTDKVKIFVKLNDYELEELKDATFKIADIYY